MKVLKMNLTIGETVNLGNYSSKRIEYGFEVELENDDQPDAIYYDLKKDIELKLIEFKNELETTKTVESITDHKEISSYIPKTNLVAQKTSNTVLSNDMKCPECKELMLPKSGKDYLLCSKHWGYPDMIEKGVVKVRAY